MKLEVGMYVRTKYHGILKYGDRFLFDDEILKASHNIIDLIEVGDYVNGHRVIFVNDTFTYASVEVETTGGATCEIIPKKYIKSIVTKEQFESMSYKVSE